MEPVTKENCKEMEGVEFDYITTRGRKCRAFVAKVDPTKGMTCKNLEQIPSLCLHGREDLICINLTKENLNPNHSVEMMLRILNEIKQTGQRKMGANNIVPADPNGNLSECIFS